MCIRDRGTISLPITVIYNPNPRSGFGKAVTARKFGITFKTYMFHIYTLLHPTHINTLYFTNAATQNKHYQYYVKTNISTLTLNKNYKHYTFNIPFPLNIPMITL